MLNRLGRFAARHHWPIIAVWLVALVAIGGYAGTHTGKAVDQFTVPGTESQAALDLLQKEFPAAAGTSALVVFEATNGKVTDQANAAAIEQAVTNLGKLPDAGTVANPTQPQITGLTFDEGKLTPVTAPILMNADQTVAYTTVPFSIAVTDQEHAEPLFDQVEAAAAPAAQAGMTVEFGGPLTDLGNPPPPGISAHSDEIGLAIAVVILVIALGSLVAMAMPISVALISVLISNLIVVALMYHYTIGSVAPVLGTMIGLGVGIDYSLFIVSRHRGQLAAGMDVHESIGTAIATSGSAVLFAGITVCIAMLGLNLMGIPYVAELGAIASLFVAVTVLAALTLLPAALGALGLKINAGRIHHKDEQTDVSNTVSARWAREIAKHPVVFAVLSLAFLLMCALPLRSIDLGFTDDGNVATELTQRRAYDLLTTNFGPGVTGPLIVAVDLPPVTKENASGLLGAFTKLNSALTATPGVARVSLPLPNTFPSSADPNAVPSAVIIELTPSTAPNSPATADLVAHLRSDVIPQAVAGTDLPASSIKIGGSSALLIDLTDGVKARFIPFVLCIIGLSFLLLMMVFRSLFVPLNAAVMNLVSIGAALGIVVAIFNWGWAKDVIGLSTVVPIVSFVPVMMFAVLFGLSMDYEVFLLSRIREEYRKSNDSKESVVMGLAATARVITSAALIMISVFLAFVPNPDPTIKMIGLGMAVAVFLDATVVRMMLVPSSMELAGKANWWLPHWLDRILPRIDLE